MTHSPSDARDLIAREVTFPANVDEAVSELEDESIRSPHGDPVSLETILSVTDEEEFDSPSALHSTVMAHLSKQHVGRPNYDGRAHNPNDDDHVSF
ncbi:MAG: hypothetical protein ABEJ77_02020 [Halanaeroarchaeum sp.]